MGETDCMFKSFEFKFKVSEFRVQSTSFSLQWFQATEQPKGCTLNSKLELVFTMTRRVNHARRLPANCRHAVRTLS